MRLDRNLGLSYMHYHGGTMSTIQIAVITAGIVLVILGIGLWLNRIVQQILANSRLRLQTAEENAKIDRREREQRLSDESMASGERVTALKADYKAQEAEALRRARQSLYNDYDRLSRELSQLSGDPLDARAPISPQPVSTQDMGRPHHRSGNGAAPQPPTYAPDAPVSPPSTGKHAAKATATATAEATSTNEASSDGAEQVEPQPSIMAEDTAERQ